MARSGSRHARGSAYQAFATVVFNTLILFLVFEALARVVVYHVLPPEKGLRFKTYREWPVSVVRYVPHPYLSYALNPDYRNPDGIRHNSLGFRGPEVPVEKPVGTFRIVALGASTTYTLGVLEDDLTYPALMGTLLRDKHGHKNVEVVNAGVPGYDSWDSLINLQFRVLPLKPDLVVIYHGTNDTHARLVKPEAYRSDNTGRRKNYDAPLPAWFEHSMLIRIAYRWRNLPDINVDRFTAAPTAYYDRGHSNPDELLDANPPIHFERNLRNMVILAKAHGAQVVLATWAYSPDTRNYPSKPYYQRGFREANDVIRRVAAEFGTPVLDYGALMSAERRYWIDGVHVNKAGAALQAEIFADFLAGSDILPAKQ